MVIISEDIQIQLKSLVEQYVDYRTKGEYGISAFWYWYYQVMNYLRCMDNAKIRSGFNKVYRMPKWGTVVYTKIVIGKEVIVYADTFKYSKRNLYDWLNHKSNKRPSYSVCDTCFGFSSVLYDNSQKYGILKTDGKPLVKPIFDDIINFHHSSDDYNTLHAIGFINDRVYEITTDGNVILLHMSKNDYLNAKHKYFEAKQRRKIIENKQYNTMKNTRNKVRLTESQLHRVIKESVKQVLSELDWKTYANAASKSALNPNRKKHHDTEKLRDASIKAFNDKYSYNDKDASYKMGGSHTYPLDTHPFMPYKIQTQARTNDNNHRLDYGYNYDKDVSYGLGHYNLNHNDYEPEFDNYYDNFGEAGKFAKTGNDELKHYYNDDYEYIKGKGWQLKDNMDESIRRAIRNTLK